MQVSVQLRDESPSILASGAATITVDRAGRVQLSVRSDMFADQRLLVMLNTVELREALTAALDHRGRQATAERPPAVDPSGAPA